VSVNLYDPSCRFCILYRHFHVMSLAAKCHRPQFPHMFFFLCNIFFNLLFSSWLWFFSLSLLYQYHICNLLSLICFSLFLRCTHMILFCWVIYTTLNNRLYPVFQATRRLLALIKIRIKQLCGMDLSLDGVYRAVVRGLQVGLATVPVACLLDIVLGISPLSTCTSFVLGILVGTTYMFYQDILEVLLWNWLIK